jgi:hypothetical protein
MEITIKDQKNFCRAERSLVIYIKRKGVIYVTFYHGYVTY